MTTKQAFYFSEGPYLQTLQGLHAALSMPEAFIKLLGTSRSGKSTLCEKLSKYLRRKGFSVIYFQAAIESPEMLRSLLSRELDLPESSNFPRLLEDALREKSEKPLILIFDNAHLLTDITLLEIYRLAEVQVDSKRVLNIVLCGEPTLEKRLLTNQEFKSLLLNVSHRFVLEPMNPEALSQFFYRYAEKSGIPGLQLEPAAMSYFYKACKGYPGPAQNMCRLMVQARLGETEMLPIGRAELVKILKHAGSKQVLPSGQAQENNRLGALIPFAAVFAVASLGFIYQQLQGGNSEEDLQLAATEIPQSIRPEPVMPTQQTDNADTQLAEPAGQPPGAGSSPFSASDPAPSVPAEQTIPAVVNDLAQAFPPAATADMPEPVSDSSLALVTAQERGVDTDSIVQPEFEPLAADTEEAPSSAVSGAEAEEEMPDTDRALVVDAGVAAAATEAESDTAAGTRSEEDSEPEADGVDSDVAAALEVEQQAPPAADSPDQSVAVVAVAPEALLQPNNAEPQPGIATGTTLDSETDSAPGSASDPTTDIAALEQAVNKWVAAWQDKELNAYFASYHTGFVPRYQDSQDEWRRNRRRVISNAEWIRLEMTEFRFIGMEADMLEVQFWLRYESPTYGDNTLKKLLMQQEEGEWRIMEEINLQVRG